MSYIGDKPREGTIRFELHGDDTTIMKVPGEPPVILKSEKQPVLRKRPKPPVKVVSEPEAMKPAPPAAPTVPAPVEKGLDKPPTEAGQLISIRAKVSVADLQETKDKIIQEPASSLTESAYHSMLHSVKGGEEFNFLSSLYYLKGGMQMKEQLQNPETRRQALDNIVATIAVDNEAIRQIILLQIPHYLDVTGHEGSLRLDKLSKIIELKNKLENQILKAIEVQGKLSFLPGIKVSNAGQVNIGVQQVCGQKTEKDT